MLCPLPGFLDDWCNVLRGVGLRRRGGSCAGALRGVGAGGLGSGAWASIVFCCGVFGTLGTVGDGVVGRGEAGRAVAGGGLRLASISRIILF